MQTLTINIPTQDISYPIHSATNLTSDITKYLHLTSYSQIAILTDQNLTQTPLIPNLHSQLPSSYLITVPPGEQHKSIDTASTIWSQLAQQHFDRKSLLINVGGGMITDLGGFVASTYMRGIDFINIPTTVLAMVDASVGGKTGINHHHIKNLIGTFNQPQAVLIDPAVLNTLPEREFNSGWAEIIKHGLVADKAYLELVTQKAPTDYTPTQLTQIIHRSNEIKAHIVTQDPTEQGLRKILNFGHTIGHALESLSHDTDTPLLHGEAIALGMLAEAHLSVQQGNITEAQLQLIKLALQNAKLPNLTSLNNTDAILDKMHSDKKTTHGQLNFSLLSRVGEANYDQQVTTDQIKVAVKYIKA